MKCITVSASAAYDVLVGRGLLKDAGRIVRAVVNASLAVLVSDSTVDALWGNQTEESLAAAGFRVLRYVFPAGEASKNTAKSQNGSITLNSSLPIPISSSVGGYS